MPELNWNLFNIPLQLVTGVYLVVGCGIFFRKKGWFPESGDDPLYKVTVFLLMPSLILHRILPVDLEGDYHNVIFPPLVGYATTLLGIGLAWTLGWLPKKLTGLHSTKTLGTFAACVGILNYGFVPIPLMGELYPNNDKMTAILFIQNLGVELSIWSIVIVAMSGKFDRKTWLRAINPPTCAIVIAVVLNLIGFGKVVPQFLLHAVKLLGDASLSVSMFLVGLSIADTLNISRMIAHWRRAVRIAFWSCLLRLIVLPAILVSVAVFVPMTIEMKRVLVVYAAMSSAIFPLVLSRHYGGDPNTAAETILPNTVLALVSAPLWISIGLPLVDGCHLFAG
ncbi:MAG: AEC family transporter [Planctomycetaceae bacterium]|nr:AEC family transporter [Planctomycetaceae bacterium]